MALGAQRRTLVAMVIRQGMIPAAGGVAIGLATAWLVSRVLSSLLFGISPRDPITFVTVAGVLGVVALAVPVCAAGVPRDTSRSAEGVEGGIAAAVIELTWRRHCGASCGHPYGTNR
jgi:predicted lysophospholipase L1 biosynthesis ABC-type transport system permease subunit